MEAISDIENKINLLNSTNAADSALVWCGIFYLNIGRAVEAEAYLQRACELNPKNIIARNGLGWAHLDADEGLQSFEGALALSPNDLSANFGRVLCYRQKNQNAKALEAINHLIAYNQGFVPAYVERLYILLALASWEPLLEAAKKILILSPENIDALFLSLLYDMCRQPFDAIAVSKRIELLTTVSKVHAGRIQARAV